MNQNTRPRGRPRNTHRTGDKSTIQSLERALDVLEKLAAGRDLTLSRIASDMRQSPSTVYRVLATLETRSMVETDPSDQTWHIGPAAFRLGSAFLRRSGLIEKSRPFMRALMEATGETANLGVERNAEVLFVSQVETQETIRAFFPPGTRSAMHSSGIGKALLSCLSDAQFTRHLRRTNLLRFTENTIISHPALAEEMAAIRVRGYAFDNEERTLGMRCIAAPVRNQYGEAVAGISVSGPTHRMAISAIPEIGATVARSARELSQNLGAPEQPRFQGFT